MLMVVLALVVFCSISYLFSTPSAPTRRSPNAQYGRELDFLPDDQPAAPLKPAPQGSDSAFKVDLDSMPTGILEGESIAPKLENATLKYTYAHARRACSGNRYKES